TADKDGKDHEMEQLKQELMELYPDRAEAIKRQNDFGVLAYLKCCEGKGPTKQIMDCIEAVSAMDKYKSFFLPAGSVVLVDEDEEDDDDGVSDTDYYSPQNNNNGNKRNDVELPNNSASWRAMERRSSRCELELPPAESSFQESGVIEEETHKEVEEGLLDALDRCRAMLLDGKKPTQSLNLRVATFMKDGLHLMADLIALNKGVNGQDAIDTNDTSDTIELFDS
ncbi:hypothetical protein BGZ54_005623, partial [Gamsiella multidivaricata]